MRASTKSLFIFLAGLFFTNCTPPAYWQNLPERDKARWKRCYRPMQRMAGCDAGYRNQDAMEVLIGDSTCLEGAGIIMESYADQPTEVHRKQWLKAHGCPPSMVDPGKY